MPTIKFSHRYDKLKMHGMHGEIAYPGTVALLEVLLVRLENLSPYFLAYDTDNGKYDLPKKGDYLMLVFQRSDNNIFTTLRRYTPEKSLYYLSNVGEQFDVEITESNKAS